MKKPILVRKQAGSGGIMYTREVGGRGQGGLMQDLAAVRGGARGLVTDPNTNNVRQGFIPGAQLGDAKPTGMQRLAAGANIAGRGLAAALTGLQTAYSLQGGNVGALGNIADNYAATVPGLTMNRPTEAQQAQDMATRAFHSTQAADAQRGMTTALQQAQRAGEAQSVPLPTATSAPAEPPKPPAGLPAPPVPAETTPAPTQPGQTNLTQFSQPPTSVSPTAAAELLPPAPTGQAAPAAPSMTPAEAAQMLPSVNQPTTTPTEPPANPAMAMFREVQNQKAMREGRETPFANQEFDPNTREGQAMAMFREVQAAKKARMQGGGTTPPVAVSQPVNQGGPAPYEQTMPVLMPQRTHEEQRQQVAVRQPVETPYTPQNTVNPFANPTGQKPGHAYNTGQYAPTEQQYGLSSNVDYRNRAMPANFGGISWDSAVPSLGDDSNFNWDEIRNAFVSQVLDEFGDMLHKADPHVAGAVAMRVFFGKNAEEVNTMSDMEEFIHDMDRKMSAKSFEYFFKEILGFDYSRHHQMWDEGLAKNRYYCVKASRDHGKSVFFMSYALWIAAFQPGKHIMIFSHSLEQTLEHMRFIRQNIENTPCIRYLIPEGRPWRKTYFEFSNGSRIMAKSVGGGTRGFHPNVVLCDDILWGTTGTELQRASDWFYGVLLPVLHHTGRLMMVGTPFSYNDLYSQLEQTETFQVETYPAINNEGEALWPERWDLESLDQRRLTMPAIQFSREYLCEPIHDVASMFPHDILEKARNNDLVLLDRAEMEYNEDGEAVGVFGQHFIGWDTAIASDKNADYTAMTVMRLLPGEDVKQIVGIVHEKGMSGLAQKNQMMMLNNRFQPDLIELEGNNFQRMFQAELIEMRQDIPIKTFMTTRTRKESLFMSLLMAFEQGRIQTPYGDKRSREFTHKLETELNRFGMQKNGRLESVGTHDDLAMSLALANWATKEFKGSVVLLDDVLPGFDEWIRGKPHRSHDNNPADGWMIP